MKLTFPCAHCGAMAEKEAGAITRAKLAGLRIYCNRTCSGLGRRTGKALEQKIAEKRLYDIEYRSKNLAAIKTKKRAYHLRSYDPDKARVERKTKMPRHVEYCRRPEYKRWKTIYDRKHRAKKFYGQFAEAAMTVIELNKEIKGRSTNAQIKFENETCNKTQRRRRDEKAETRARPRHRERRDGHSTTNG